MNFNEFIYWYEAKNDKKKKKNVQTSVLNAYELGFVRY
jgi:hypothetical protein